MVLSGQFSAENLHIKVRSWDPLAVSIVIDALAAFLVVHIRWARSW